MGLQGSEPWEADISAQPGEELTVHQVPVTWGDVSELPVLASNQFAVQVDVDSAGQPDSLILTFGHAGPPIVSGTAEEIRTQTEKISQVTVQPLMRLQISIKRAAEFSAVLQRTLAILLPREANNDT
jgi:hypothetical protein